MWFSMNPGLEVDLEFQPTRKYTVIISQIQGKQLHFTFDRETWNITSIFCLRKIYKKISEMKRNQRFGSSKVGSRLATQKVVQHQPISSLRSPSTPNSDYQGLFGHFLGPFSDICPWKPVLDSCSWKVFSENPIKPHLGRPYSLVGTPAASTISEPNRLLPQRNIQRRQTKKG